MQTLFSRKQLAERRGYPSTKPIEELENKGVLKRIPAFAGVRYSINQIEQIENTGIDVDPLSPEERVKKDRKIKELENKISTLEETISAIKGVIANVLIIYSSNYYINYFLYYSA